MCDEMTYIHQAKVGQASNKGTTISREGQAEAPELPLEADYGHDSKTLEDHGERRLAPRHATVQQADARDDEEDEAAHNDLVDISSQRLVHCHVSMYRILTRTPTLRTAC